MRNRFIFFISLILLFVSVVTYGQSDDANAKESFLQTIQKELESLRAFGADEKAHPETTIQYLESMGKWHAFYGEYDSYSYDIQKTNSIVSPYIGIVTFKEKEFIKEGNSKAECLNSQWEELRLQKELTLKYVYQDGTWILKDAPRLYKSRIH